MTIDSETLKNYLHYNSDNGEFTWINPRGYKVKPGAKAGCLTSHGYIQIGINNHLYFGHILAWLYMTGGWPQSLIDHRNRIRSDNSWGNLRLSTYSQNTSNSKIDRRNTSGSRGVFFDKRRNTWFGYIQIDGNKKYLGSFKNKEDAASAVQNARDSHYGEFSN